MKIKILSLVAIIATCSITFNARAATMCGPVDSDGYIYYMETDPYVCLRGNDISDNRNSELAAYNNEQMWGINGLCVDYTSTKSDAGHTYLTNCTISSHACGNKYYYTGTDCSLCPAGYIAAPAGKYHTNTTCYQTCEYNQYLTDAGCKPCPGNNAAAAPGERHTYTTCNLCLDDRYYYDPDADDCKLCPQNGQNIGDNEIDHCYITDGSDESGTYKYTEDCYYSL